MNCIQIIILTNPFSYQGKFNFLNPYIQNQSVLWVKKAKNASQTIYNKNKLDPY